MSDGYASVRKLVATDLVDAFDCGQAALNQFLQRYALVNQRAGTYVAKTTWSSASIASPLAVSIRMRLHQE